MTDSNVGSAGVYEAKDQRTEPQDKVDEVKRFEEGKDQSHQAQDPKDERSIANRLAAADDQNDPESGSGKTLTKEDKAAQIDPTLPARMHGNEPSRGAKIDKEIEDEEAELIRKMDEKKEQKKH